MADAPQGIALFPGVRFVVSASYTLQHGISPGVVTLTIAPQANVPTRSGTFEMRFVGTNVRLRMPGCKVDSATFIYDANQQVVQLQLWDRRWKWAFGAVSGHYNIIRDGGTIVRSSLKSPQELARLCLAAMGEANFDVSGLPNKARPQVEWEFENPAHALQQLCDDLGCRIVLDRFGRVRIVETGVGSKLPLNLPIIDASGTLDRPETPDALVIVGAPNRYQRDFDLEAVGEDTGGVIRPIDELSYKPSGGWEASDEDFWEVTDEDDRERALSSVFRWYRLKIRRDGERQRLREPFNEAGVDVQYLDQIVPLEAAQVAVADNPLLDDASGLSLPAVVWGVWYDGNLSVDENTVSGNDPQVPKVPSIATTYYRSFSLDRDLGIVKFAERVYWQKSDGTSQPARLRLRCAFSIRDADTRAFVRYTHTRRLARNGTQPRYIRREDVIANRYTNDNGKVIENRREVVDACNEYLDAAQREYQQTDPASATYAGLVPFGLDGAIQSITWSVGPQGATTKVSRNDERTNPATVPYKMRRYLERIANEGRKPQKGPAANRREREKAAKA